MNLGLQKIFIITALVLLFGQGANQIFCGDIDCLEGGSMENCTTLLCSILGSHTKSPFQQSEENHDQECKCVCHLQFNQTDGEQLCYELPLIGQVAIESTSFAGFLSHPIYRPPTT